MIKFSLIPPHLQINIAEKLPIKSQGEFEFSSKHGRRTLKKTSHKAIANIFELRICENDARLTILEYTENFDDCKMKYICWNQIRENPDLPRLAVSTLIVEENFSRIALREIYDKAGFASKHTQFYWDDAPISAPIFAEISSVFNIVLFRPMERPELETFCLPEFQKVEHLQIPVNNVPDDLLLNLKGSQLRFTDVSSPSAAQYFVQQWFQKTRKMEWLEMVMVKNSTRTFQMERLLEGLPFSVIKRHEEEYSVIYVQGVNTTGYRNCAFQKGDVVYSVDRGDRKLLLFLAARGDVIAREYVDLKVLRFNL